jgi:hypothetical protein
MLYLGRMIVLLFLVVLISTYAITWAGYSSEKPVLVLLDGNNSIFFLKYVYFFGPIFDLFIVNLVLYSITFEY